MDGYVRTIREPPNDPNRGQNRVPTQVELGTLRNIQSDNRQLVATINNRIRLAKDAHGRIQNRYDHLLQELEGIQSELNISYDYIATLEQQEDTLKAKDQELIGLLHPIRRCPEDVLTLIFECFVDEVPGERLRRATVLSHVCKPWRAFALRASRLWTQVVVSMNDDLGAIKLFSDRTRARLRSIPADVTIKDIHYNNSTRNFKKSFQLDRFKSIATMRYLLGTTEELTVLEDLIPKGNSELVKTLNIEAEVDNDDGGGVEWECWPFFQAFPNLQSLNLLRVGYPQLDGLDSLSSLRCITLNEASVPSFTLYLPRLEGLEELEIMGNHFTMEMLEEDIILSLLHTLTFVDAHNFPWRKISAPRLRKFVVDEESEAVMDFCCTHQSIRDLTLKHFTSKAGFTKLSNALGDLETLEIGGFVDPFFDNGSTEIPFPPFPKLTHLAVDLREDYYISKDGFENFVRSRCISSSSGDPDIGPKLLRSWDIIDYDNEFEAADWRNHPLLQHCTQTRTGPNYDDIVRLHLEWTR